MMTKLLAFGTTLIDLVRTRIPYSENISQLFDDIANSSAYIKKNKEKIREIRKGHDILWEQDENDLRESDVSERDISHRQYVQKTLEAGVGYCAELTMSAQILALDVDIFSKSQRVYCSKIRFTNTNHTMLLLHQDVFMRKAIQYYTSDEGFSPSLDVLSQKTYAAAVIVDPWIYQVTPLKHHQKHIKAAEKYDVYQDYQGEVKFDSSFLLGSETNFTGVSDPILEKMVREFKGVYEEYLMIISKMDNPDALTGRTFFTARANFAFRD